MESRHFLQQPERIIAIAAIFIWLATIAQAVSLSQA